MSSLEGVKVGDTIKCARSLASAYDLFRVDRLTATQAVCSAIGAHTDYKQSFKLDRGLMIGSGDSFRTRYGSICTDADLAKIALANRIRATHAALQNLRVTAENIDAIDKLIAEDNLAKKSGK